MRDMVPRLGAALRYFLLVGAMLTAPAAQAQMTAPGTNSSGLLTGPVVGAQSGQPKKTAPPPALPGARTPDTDPAPADRPASEMHPNEALFDAVNRGDIGSARDAIGRGADLNARDVLGLTPLDLSVDLGRNDITFLLLSLRGASPGSAPPADNKPARPVKAASRSAPQHPAGRSTLTAVAAAPQPAPRQYADTPGTPVPEAGFLGFGSVTR